MIIPRPDSYPENDSIFMIVNDNSVFQASGKQVFPDTRNEYSRQLWDWAEYTARIGDYLGRGVYLIVSTEQELFDGFELMPLRSLLGKVDTLLFALAGRACQVAYFIRTHNFCSHCGDALDEVTDELAVYCARCDYRTYPRISPCIIVAVYRVEQGKGQLLLARGARHKEGMYSVLAGFVESGESLEQTLHREVYEETGVEVDNVEYVMSQQWPFPHSLMAGFVARHSHGQLTVDGVEILDADWFDVDALPQTPPPGTIAAQLIDEAVRRIQQQRNQAE